MPQSSNKTTCISTLGAEGSTANATTTRARTTLPCSTWTRVRAWHDMYLQHGAFFTHLKICHSQRGRKGRKAALKVEKYSSKRHKRFSFSSSSFSRRDSRFAFLVCRRSHKFNSNCDFICAFIAVANAAKRYRYTHTQIHIHTDSALRASSILSRVHLGGLEQLCGASSKSTRSSVCNLNMHHEASEPSQTKTKRTANEPQGSSINSSCCCHRGCMQHNTKAVETRRRHPN